MAKYKIIPSSRTIVQSPISIGHKAEKGVEAIEFDLTAWVETYGSGTATIVMKRWGDSIPYPIALEIDENNKATWTLSDIDTAKAGMAYAQLSYVVGDEVVKKSDIYTFRVMDSLTGEGEPPEAYDSWLEHLTHLAAEAMAEVLDIEGIVTDKTLTVDGGIADGKATGDALALKADKSTTYTKTEVDQMIEDVEVETDTTLEIAGAPADAAETGRQIGLLKADLENLEPGLSATAKAALLECIRHIARWDDDNGETYYNNLYEALYGVPIIAPVFRYNPASDGLLSTQDYVESATINEGASESLVNGKLVLSAAKGASQSGSSYALFVMDEYDNVYGRLKVRAKISATKFTPDTHVSGNFRVEVSNATKGAQFYIMETNQGYLKVEYVVGTTRTAVTTTIEAEQYHDFEFIAKGDTQKLTIDGTTVVNANGLSTQYVSTVRMWAMSGSSNTDIQLTIDSVEYYDEEG